MSDGHPELVHIDSPRSLCHLKMACRTDETPNHHSISHKHPSDLSFWLGTTCQLETSFGSCTTSCAAQHLLLSVCFLCFPSCLFTFHNSFPSWTLFLLCSSLDLVGVESCILYMWLYRLALGFPVLSPRTLVCCPLFLISVISCGSMLS